MSHSALDAESKMDTDGACNQQHLNQGKSERFALFKCWAQLPKKRKFEKNKK